LQKVHLYPQKRNTQEGVIFKVAKKISPKN
jgi:hypothetical protein